MPRNPTVKKSRTYDVADATIAAREPVVTKPTYIPCERCGDECFYEPPHPAEPDVGVGAWRGGYACACGWCKENEPATCDDHEGTECDGHCD